MQGESRDGARGGEDISIDLYGGHGPARGWLSGEPEVVRRRLGLAALAFVATGFALGALTTGALRPRHDGFHGPAAASAPPPSGRITATELEGLGVRFAPVHRAAEPRSIDVVGTLALDREHSAEVSTHAAGRVTHLRAAVGQSVRRGDVLGTIESPDIGRAAADYLTHQAELRTARQQLARQRALHAQSLTVQREVELAEAAVRTASAGMDAAAARLRALGVAPERVRGSATHAPLVAPIDGVVIRRGVLLGSWVQPETVAFAIADLANLWVELDVFESDLGAVAAGDPVTLDVRALGLADVPGVVQLLHAEVDPATRMGRVRVVVPNRDGRLRPGLSVAAHVRPRGGDAGLRVPVESVRERDGAPHVLVRRGEEVAWRRVQVGARRGGAVEVTSGLASGDVVAVAGLGLVAGSL